MDWVNPLAKVNNKFKFQLFGKQYDSLIPLYTQIPKYDPSNHGALSEHAFNLLLNAGGIFLTTQEIRTIKDAFPAEPGIAYRQFVDNVRNDITEKRLATIDFTFLQFQQNGRVAISALLSSLRSDKHPHVRSLMKKAEKVQRDIEDGLNYWSHDGKTFTRD
jgi:Ca2+-binding EF-hand superfamily protein